MSFIPPALPPKPADLKTAAKFASDVMTWLGGLTSAGKKYEAYVELPNGKSLPFEGMGTIDDGENPSTVVISCPVKDGSRSYVLAAYEGLIIRVDIKD